MPSSTFTNLPSAKRERIRAALLAEFSQHSLADAQVARIIAAAQIARGAFYKYFTDLTDAYQYVFASLMDELHPAAEATSQPQTPAFYVERVRRLVSATSANQEFFKLHYTTNEGLLPQPDPGRLAAMPASTWAVMELSHATIKACLMTPAAQPQLLARLEQALTKLLGDD